MIYFIKKVLNYSIKKTNNKSVIILSWNFVPKFFSNSNLDGFYFKSNIEQIKFNCFMSVKIIAIFIINKNYCLAILYDLLCIKN